MKTITPEDFDNAVKQPWASSTCLLAQAALRQRLPGHETPFIRLLEGLSERAHDRAADLMAIFDGNFIQPGDEKKPEMQALRASLPVELV